MSWQGQAETLIRSIAGADADGPLYFVDGDELPANMVFSDCLALTGATMATAMEPWLKARDRWQGDGFCTVVYPSRIAKRKRITLPDVLNAACIAACVHEFAHCLPELALRRIVGAEFPEPAIEPSAALALMQSPLTTSPPWAGHEAPTFVRACLHLSSRAFAAGHWLPPRNLHCAGPAYGLSDICDYATALGDEVEQLATMPVSQILATPAPDAFQALWNSDTEAAK
jgi:hypothetical protein